jgi:diazepam-binding inhibitor (GABA receptor modulator, acyl-CoA-binding protein)
MSLDERFSDAQARVRQLSARPGNEVLLELYALYKQGSLGDVRGARPGMLDFTGRAKFDAWAARKGMDPDDAKTRYIALVDRLAAG